MLGYEKQYDILFSMYLTYNTKSLTKLHSVFHGDDVRQEYLGYWPLEKYQSYTPNKFKITILYIIYNYTPSSVHDILNKLHTVEYKDVEVFYNNIVNYTISLKKDIEYLSQKFGSPTLHQVVQSYVGKNIEFYTFWWYLKYTDNLETIKKSNIYGGLIYKIQFLLLYIKFKESSLQNIKTVLLQSDIFN